MIYQSKAPFYTAQDNGEASIFALNVEDICWAGRGNAHQCSQAHIRTANMTYTPDQWWQQQTTHKITCWGLR